MTIIVLRYQNDPEVSVMSEIRRLYEAGDVKALSGLLHNNTRWASGLALIGFQSCC